MIFESWGNFIYLPGDVVDVRTGVAGESHTLLSFLDD